MAKVVFVDRVTVWSLLRMWAFGQSVGVLWHFDPVGRRMARLLGIVRSLRLIRAEVREMEYHIGQVRDGAGWSLFADLLGRARAIRWRIKREQLVENPLIRAMGSEWKPSKVVLYFDKLAEREVDTECLRIGLITWLLRNLLGLDPSQCALLIERGQWFPYIQAQGQAEGLRVIGYGFWNARVLRSGVSQLLRLVARVLLPLGTTLRGLLGVRAAAGPVAAETPHGSAPSDSTIAIRYYHRPLSFDLTERSEFFWLEGSGIHSSELLLYDYASDRPLDAATRDGLRSRGVRLLGRGPGIPKWRPTWRMSRVLLGTTCKLLTRTVRSCVQGQWVAPYYLTRLLALVQEYAYWYDFYTSNRVRVNVAPTFNASVGQVLALDALGGVSAAYQYSLIRLPTTLISAGENVQFVFSPFLERRLWRTLEAPVVRFVHTGYIYDGAIDALRGFARVREGRRALQENGARFVLCFFDQNSVKRWDIPASDEDAAADYEFLLRWLLEDPTLGIIFKPKRSGNLFQRIARVSGLIDAARQTGRCRFLTSETLLGSIFPAEAALMADVCIGKLLGSSAALEARLAGIPTVLIDTEGFRAEFLDGLPRGRVVFEDWPSLRAAVERYRAAPAHYPEFGDWSAVLDDLDPFRDGRAAARMGTYIRSVYEALKRGLSQQEALVWADAQFQQRWRQGAIR